MPDQVGGRQKRPERVAFLIGGTQKGGTSALHDYLVAHPRIRMARDKEAHFFDYDELFASGRVSLPQYHAFFDPAPGVLWGDATPIYMYWRSAPVRIWHYNPRMKWILLLRNPIDRAYSHWNMEVSRGAEALPFLAAIKQEHSRWLAASPRQPRVHSYLDRGYYAEQIRRIWHHFPREQMLIFKSEELAEAPQQTISTICGFLGISNLKISQPRRVREGHYRRPMTPEERDYLRSAYEFEIRQLERMLGWDCSSWLD